jgi:chromatin remodeling complex protein RSC6
MYYMTTNINNLLDSCNLFSNSFSNILSISTCVSVHAIYKIYTYIHFEMNKCIQTFIIYLPMTHNDFVTTDNNK